MASSREQKKLEESYHWIRRQLFPRWDHSNTWRIRHGWKSGIAIFSPRACCDTPHRTIWVSSEIMEQGEPELRKVLVHEICHALTTAKHGRLWFSKMKEKVDRAKRLGMDDLSCRIEQEVIDYRDAIPEVTASSVYSMAESVLWEMTDAPYELVRDLVSQEIRMDPKETETRYPRLKKVVERERKFVEQERRGFDKSQDRGKRVRKKTVVPPM